MRIAVPGSVPPRWLEAVARAAPGVEVSRLGIVREESRAARWIDAARGRLSSLAGGRRSPSERPVQILLDGKPVAAPDAGVDALLATDDVDRPVMALLMDALPDLRWVHSTMTGVDRLEPPSLAARDIQLSSCRGVQARRIAEFVVGIVAAEAKQLPGHLARGATGAPAFTSSTEFRDLTVGIAGYGAIGQALARLCRTLGIGVVAWSRRPAGAGSVEGARVTDRLEEVLSAANVMVLALPLTPDTRGRIGAAELRLLPRGAVLVNVGRGATLAETALAEALASGSVARAWLDVRSVRHLPGQQALQRSGRLVDTAHSASESRHTEAELLDDFLANLRARLAGAPLPGGIDPRRGY